MEARIQREEISVSVLPSKAETEKEIQTHFHFALPVPTSTSTSTATSTSDFQLPPPFSFSTSLILPPKDSYKYLGLIFDYKLGWHEQTAAVQKKLQQWVSRISRIIPAVADGPGPSFFVIRQLTHSILRSQVCYGLPIWSPPTQQMKQQLQSLLTRPLLRSLALPQSTHQLSLLVECASTSFSALYQSSLVNFYQHLQRTPTQQPTYQLFQQQRARFVSEGTSGLENGKGFLLARTEATTTCSSCPARCLQS